MIRLTLLLSSIIIVVLTYAQPAPVQSLPALILSPGETRTLASQRWEFSHVIIPAGATLKVTGGNSVFHMLVHDSMKLQGTIIAREFSSEERQVLVTVPGQSQPLVITYENKNVGGNGGYGGQGGGVSGGRGARGTVDYGGGGASGGGRHSDRLGVKTYPGLDAVDERGAPWSGGSNCGSPGGNGGLRSINGNGGVVFLEIRGKFDGSGGLIDVSGSDGEDGQPGVKPSFPSSVHGCQSGGGAGGGGAPGGQGGYIILSVKGGVVQYPSLNTRAGKGGKGGTAPVYSNMSGTNGSNGQAGKNGNFYFYPG